MRTALWIVLALNVAGSLSAEEDWRQFRGPTGEGHSGANRLPLNWDENHKVVWRTAIHDHGWSSPVVCEKQIWMTSATADGHKLFAVCVDRQTGKIVHDVHVFDVARPQPISAENTYATPTPAIQPGRVYVHYGTYGTACLNTATGAVVWTRRDLNCDHESGAGPCSSPFLLGNMLIVNVDGRDVQYLIALDPSSGRTVWKTNRSFDYSTVPVHMRKAFTMPLLVPRGSGQQLVSPGGQAVYGYDPATGKELWKVRHGGFSLVPRPVYGHGLVFVVTDHDNPQLWAVRPDGIDDVTDTHVAWKETRGIPARSSPLLVEDLLYVTSGSLAATFAISGTKASGRVLGANDRVRIAVAGINGRGQQHITAYGEMRDVEIAWLVDPDSRLFASRSAAVQKLAGNTPQCVQDFRRALNDKTLDAVSIVTPNHWHALLTIWACRAGKDVLVEKPCSHNIVEGRRLVEAARKYDRIVQHGTQRRSDPKWSTLTADVRNGKYGQLRLARIQIHRPRESIGVRSPERPPVELDYNLWNGPAPVHPYRTNLVPYDWHWIWDFGNGEIGNLGTHQLDVARWAMPAGAAPRSVLSVGGRFGYQDQGQTPNTQLTLFDCGDVKLLCEQRGLVAKKEVKVTVDFHTTGGVVKESKFFPQGQQQGQPIADAPVGGFADLGRLHFRNFIDCIRSRKREELNAEILEGHRSALLAHLGNISYRLGKNVPFDTPTKAFGGDPSACEAFAGLQQHLGEAPHLRLKDHTYRRGRLLRFDSEAERFIGDPEADRLLTRPCREPLKCSVNRTS